MSDPSFQAPSPEHLTELLPQYDIEAFIAQGAMGAVYKARQRSLDRDVAIKILPRELGEDPAFRESFTTEAKAMARLNHPNLIGVFDFGDVEGMPYIVMEYVPGCSLHDSAWNQAVESSQAVAIVKGICDGLAHAHEHGIVHRDIKPANILLTPKAEPKIVDFGLAHAADSDKPGLVMGTPGYTAPEVFQDPDQAGPLADQYSVGVVLHQLLTGIDPAGSEGPPTRTTGNLRLDAIWRKATDIDPARRYPNLAAMAADLEQWFSAPLATGSHATGPARRTVPATLHSAPPARPIQIHTNSGGGGVMVKLAVAAILVTVVGFTYQLLQEQKPEIKESLANTDDDSPTENPDPMAVPEPRPEPPASERFDPAPTPEPEPVEIATRDEPGAPPVREPEPEPEPEAELPPGDPDLRERAIALILEARAERNEALAANARSLIFKLGVHARNATSAEANFITGLGENIIDNRIPVFDDDRALPDGVADDFKRALAKEHSIIDDHRADLARIRKAYVTRLEDAAAETSDEALVERLLAQAGRASDLNAWVGLLAPGNQQPTGGPSRGFVGDWDRVTYGNEHRHWAAHPDGRLEVVDSPYENSSGVWEIREDGTLHVRFGQKLYTFTRDGDGWTGKNPHGGRATLTPGD